MRAEKYHFEMLGFKMYGFRAPQGESDQNQDMFDHDKGRKFAIRPAVSTGFLELSPVDSCLFFLLFCV